MPQNKMLQTGSGRYYEDREEVTRSLKGTIIKKEEATAGVLSMDSHKMETMLVREEEILSLKSTTVTTRTPCFNIKHLFILPKPCIYVFPKQRLSVGVVMCFLDF
jgi:hypothetical protein